MARKKITQYTGPQGRIDRIRNVITDLVRKERYGLYFDHMKQLHVHFKLFFFIQE
jgi:hypothetical protein